MKRAVLILAAVASVMSSPSEAQGANDAISTAFENYGLCGAAISKYFTFDWKSQKEGNGERYNQYVHELACRKIGDYWFIVPLMQ